MSGLGDLYQELILDHNAHPRNFGQLKEPTHRAEGRNPLCGDSLSLYLSVDADVIVDIAFIGTGCAISKASTSLMTSALKGKTIAEAEALFEQFHNLTTGDGAKVDAQSLGKLVVFSGVGEFPARVKCATLAWHTMRAALHGSAAVSTE